VSAYYKGLLGALYHQAAFSFLENSKIFFIFPCTTKCFLCVILLCFGAKWELLLLNSFVQSVETTQVHHLEILIKLCSKYPVLLVKIVFENDKISVVQLMERYE
jgi:hypothetical protein